MNTNSAKKIGANKALKVATIGSILAFLIMVLFSGGNIFWLFNFNYIINIVIGLIILYGCAYFFGQNAGHEILVKKKGSELVGLKYGVFTLLITAFLAGWTGFIQEGLEPYDSYWDSFEDYIFKPFFWIVLVGLIPAIILGILFGNWIKKSK